MQTIRRRLSLILILCSTTAVLLSMLFVNVTITNTFNRYMEDIQAKRNIRLVEFFQQVYKRDGQWYPNSGGEITHEAYMSNYCLTLLDENKRVIWAMNPDDVQYKNHIMLNGKEKKGIYITNLFPINVDNKIAGYLEVGQYSPILLSKEDVSFKYNINRSIISSILLTIAIVAVISLLLSKQFSTPIKAVADTSVNLSNGNYSTKSNIKSDIVEIDNLIHSINSLGDKLNSQDLLRKRLVSDISHEIRTPLNVLQNNLEAMVDGYIPVTTERLNSLNEEVIRFGKLLNNLNVLKEVEAEDMDLHLELIHIDEIIQSVCTDFKVAAAEKNIELIINKDDKKDYIVLGDADNLRQAFINLISNAVKFTGPNGKVWISVKVDWSHVIVQVKDTGIGIKEQDLPFIFERMYRGDKSRHRIEGSGIGLTIVKKILLMHSATIEVESKENNGTMVTVVFNKAEKI
jgi:two-component system, OmpR family, sensor histidine kinase BaeS